MDTFRIHGDNIVECERIANLILNTLKPKSKTSYLISPSTVTIELHSTFLTQPLHWKLILLPGFNKNTKHRWEENIFDTLKDAGSFFDETPDAIITEIDDNYNETKAILPRSKDDSSVCLTREMLSLFEGQICEIEIYAYKPDEDDVLWKEITVEVMPLR